MVRDAPDTSTPVRVRSWRVLSMIGLVAAVTLILVLYAAGARDRAADADRNVWRPAQVATRDLLASVVDQETGQRGFLITADEAFLEPYTEGRSRSMALIDELARLFADDRVVASRVDGVETALAAWRNEAADEIEVARTDPIAARQAVASGRGKQLLDEFRQQLASLQATIDDRSRTSEDDRETSFEWLLVAIAIGGGTFVATGVLGVRRISKLLDLRQQALDDRAALATLNEQVSSERDRLASLFQAVIDRSPVGVGVFDPDQRMISVNQALARRSRLSTEQQLGRTPHELLPQPIADEAKQLLARAAAGEQILNVAVSGRSPDGEQALHFLVSYYPIFDADDSLIAIGTNLVDVTEERATAEQLGETAERLRDVIAHLQTSLLPRAIPNTPGFEIAVHYRSASADVEIGGDFYDVSVRRDGAVTITIGDVCGHDIDAATVTGAVRNTIAAASQHLDDPAVVLQWANQMLLDDAGDMRFVTAIHGQLRRHERDATFVLATAGHPLAILVPAIGAARYIGLPGRLLGVFTETATPNEQVSLAVGDQIVLYTDGLAENARPRLDECELLDLVETSTAATAAETASEILQRYDALQRTNRSDDLALMVIHFTDD